MANQAAASIMSMEELQRGVRCLRPLLDSNRSSLDAEGIVQARGLIDLSIIHLGGCIKHIAQTKKEAAEAEENAANILRVAEEQKSAASDFQNSAQPQSNAASAERTKSEKLRQQLNKASS